MDFHSATLSVITNDLAPGAGAALHRPPGLPHAFKNTGTGPLVSVDIHASPVFDTEWL